MTKPGRIACEVPFCRRTADAAKVAPDSIIVCWKCWRLADARPRKLYRLAKRKFKATGDARFARLRHIAFMRCRKQAIERAAGI